MPAPTVATYDVSVLVQAHTAVRDVIDSGVGPGYIELLSESDVLLATITLTDPCGTVNGTTGQLTLTDNSATVLAVAAGIVSWARVRSSDAVTRASFPATTGTSASPGYIVLNSLTLITDGPVVMLSATIG